jgi:hypothetical protein
MELEELRQRLLLRSKSSDIPPIAHPVQIPDIALSKAGASKVKWESTLAPEVTARIGNPARAETPENANPNHAKAPTSEAQANSASNESKPVAAAPAQAEPISILANTVDQLSAPTEAFREHFAQLGMLLQPIDAATASTEQALKRIAGLHEHLSGLANTFQSVKAFAEQVKTLSVSFEPMKALNAQLELVMAALYSNVKELGSALGPVKSFQSKVRQLATTLDSIENMEGQIGELAEMFRPEKPATAAANPNQPPQVAQAA